MTEPEGEVRRTMSFDYVLPSEAARDAFEDKAFGWFVDAAEEAGGQCDGASAGPFADEPEETELERLPKLEAIVRDLAEHSTIEARADGSYWCRLCHSRTQMPVSTSEEHAESCPWRCAVELMSAQPEDSE